MEKPNRKLKKSIIILGITGMVYAGFKYLLPLVIPFLTAFFLAMILRPSVEYLEKKCRITIKHKVFHLPPAVIAAAELILLFLLLAAGAYVGGRKLWQEAALLADNLPAVIQKVDIWLTGWCRKGEAVLGVSDGILVKQVQDMLRSLARTIKSGAMPYMMTNSMAIVKALLAVSVVFVVIFAGTIMSVQEMEAFQKYMKKSLFREEYAMLRRLLLEAGKAYGRTQLTIMLLTTGICIAGLFFLGSPYYVLLGIVIGIFDALPLFGTGTVFIPWAVISLLSGKTGYAAGLFFIYFICYLLREVLEAKLMGNKVGLSPLQTLIAIYVGLKLFGLLGFILGPIGFLIIRDAAEIYQN